MKILIYFLSFFVLSCSLFKRENKYWAPYKEKKDNQTRDRSLLEHQQYVVDSFIKNNRSLAVEITRSKRKYLQKLESKIKNTNELFFSKTKNNKNKYYLIKDKRPVAFSSPKGKIFLTTGLIKKYIKHESNIVSILVFELVKIEKKLFMRKEFFPSGYFSFEEIVSSFRIPIEEKIKNHKWSFYLLKLSLIHI